MAAHRPILAIITTMVSTATMDTGIIIMARLAITSMVQRTPRDTMPARATVGAAEGAVAARAPAAAAEEVAVATDSDAGLLCFTDDRTMAPLTTYN